MTSADVENSFELSMIKSKPVIALAAIGETPMSPVITPPGTLVIPAFARITKFPAVRRLIAVVAPATLTMAATESKNRFMFIILDLDLDLDCDGSGC